MHDFFKQLKPFVLRGDQDRNALIAVRGDIMAENHRLMRIYSAITTVILFALTILSVYDVTISASFNVYLISGIVSLAFLAFSLCKYTVVKRVVPYVVVAMSFLILVFGVALGASTANDTPTLTFTVLLIAVPLLFTLLPWQNIAITLAGIVLYLIVGSIVQTAEMFRFNMLNLIVYGFVGIVVGSYMTKIKLERFVALRENRRLSERDQLTGLLNRRCYEQHLASIALRADRGSMKICIADVNGLKKANDTLGHAVGDTLIIGAGTCLKDVLGDYGKCYRIGGDEFAVVMDKPSPSMSELLAQLEARTALWDEHPELKLSISFGFASGDESPDIKQVAYIADKRMYADKERHYLESNEDRRKATA